MSDFQFKDADQEMTYGQVKKQGDSNTLKCNKKTSQHHQILKRNNIKKKLNKIQRNPTNEKKKKT